MASLSNDFLSKLSDLGLSAYESKAYLALLRDHPATAYEIGKSSGVPTSKIYEVLNRLLEKKMITAVEGRGRTGNGLREAKRRYSPIQPNEFLNRYQGNMTSVIQSLKEGLAVYGNRREASYIWNIADREALFERAHRMIAGAEKVVLGSLWNEELEPLMESFRQAERRAVGIALVHFGLPKLSVGQIYYHPIEDTLYAEKGGRAFVLVADSRQVLMGTVAGDGSTEGVYSENRGFVTIAEDYVKHDVYITKIIKRFDRKLIEAFGKRYAKLRDVLHDEDLLSGMKPVDSARGAAVLLSDEVSLKGEPASE
jgi:sugar-specific transcriptional regulator TrmB